MLDNDPLWYKDAILYEVHVRAFHDSVGDGYGDFRGLSQKLDYLQDLGVTAIWLLPFYPSPMKDDGYDIAAYTSINPQYGRLRDFVEFLEAAHARGLRVITELVINHTSDQHPWFQRARRSPPGSPERDFYVWSDTPEKYKEARIIFKDFEQSNWTWDPIAKAYYWHRFYSHQPDLNFDNPAVWDALFPILDFWMELGVDGMRLDAIPYLYEREGTSCENLVETHVYLKALRQHMDRKFPGRMFLAEANQWPEDAVAYFGNGDECHVAFHFPIMPRLFMSIHMEDRFPIVDILAQTPPIPDNCQWAMFLRNHDELTLEMVTDEERDYMYRAYAAETRARINLGIRRRLAPLLGNSRRRIELMNGLLFSLPGTPVLYYGDEIGMGDNVYLGDRNGVRTPMQWSGDRNAGFSRANPQKLYLPVVIDPEYHYEAINVEAQQNNTNSLLWWMKRLIALRKRYRAFSRGTLEFLHPANRKALAFLRRYQPPAGPDDTRSEQEEVILVVANLSRFVQHVELDLSALEGHVPVELFGRTAFPRVGKDSYPITLGPHSFLWFALEPQKVTMAAERAAGGEAWLPTLSVARSWEDLLQFAGRKRLDEVLLHHLHRSAWASGGPGPIKAAHVREAFRLKFGEGAGQGVAHVCLVVAEYMEGNPRTFLVPLMFIEGEAVERLRREHPEARIAHVRGAQEGMLVDALVSPAFCREILQAFASGKSLTAGAGEVAAHSFTPFPTLQVGDEFSVRFNPEEQAHTSVIINERFVLKVFRRIEEGIHNEVEMGLYLHEKASFPHCAPVLGVVEYRGRAEPVTLIVLHGFVPNQGTAWQYSLDELSRYYERVLALPADQQHAPPVSGLRELMHQPVKPHLQELIGRYLEDARLLGQRTAELHRALAAEHDDPAFVPEPFTQMYQRSLYQSMRNQHRRSLDLLGHRVGDLKGAVGDQAHQVMAAGEEILDRFRVLLKRKLTGQRVRVHGDYNLCEVLFTGKDFVMIDFEGDGRRSLSERRIKRSPLWDVASMVRSYNYAAASVLMGNGIRRGQAPGLIRPEDQAILAPWAGVWFGHVGGAFLHAYREHSRGAAFLPGDDDEFWLLMEVFLLEKAIQELQHELEHRLDWAYIPLQGILSLRHQGGAEPLPTLVGRL